MNPFPATTEPTPRNRRDDEAHALGDAELSRVASIAGTPGSEGAAINSQETRQVHPCSSSSASCLGSSCELIAAPSNPGVVLVRFGRSIVS